MVIGCLIAGAPLFILCVEGLDHVIKLSQYDVEFYDNLSFLGLIHQSDRD